MSQFDLTDEQRQIQEMAQQFTADAITPHASEWDEKHIFPRDTIRRAAELGFGAIYVSEESGGVGLGRVGGGPVIGGGRRSWASAPSTFPRRAAGSVSAGSRRP